MGGYVPACVGYVFSQVRAIPITTIGMRLPRDRIDVESVAASKPQALGMVVNAGVRLNRYCVVYLEDYRKLSTSR